VPGVFVDGHVLPGSVIAIYPGIVVRSGLLWTRLAGLVRSTVRTVPIFVNEDALSMRRPTGGCSPTTRRSTATTRTS